MRCIGKVKPFLLKGIYIARSPKVLHFSPKHLAGIINDLTWTTTWALPLTYRLLLGEPQRTCDNFSDDEGSCEDSGAIARGWLEYSGDHAQTSISANAVMERPLRSLSAWWRSGLLSSQCLRGEQPASAIFCKRLACRCPIPWSIA